MDPFPPFSPPLRWPSVSTSRPRLYGDAFFGSPTLIVLHLLLHFYLITPFQLFWRVHCAHE